MKIRKGFVSNSSSTSFIFNFKTGDKEECKNIIEKYKEYFNIYDHKGVSAKNDRNLTSDEIIFALRSHLDYNNRGELKDINELLEQVTHRKEYYLDLLSTDGDEMFHDFFMEEAYTEELLKDLIGNGFKYYFVIDFGDNGGDVSGGKMGSIMDYLGRFIFISKDDLYMYTEQNR